ncbi:MAG: signal transduction histidine kinase [Candidatus Marinamargulisbacteria bacterium]|jgi:signal transduction histidine kinase
MPNPNHPILIVDDEPGVQALIRSILSDHGYETELAGSKEDALQKFEATSPAVVVTDVKMPGTDGLSLLKLLSKHHPDIPVILITGHGDKEITVQALRDHAFDYIDKPFQDEELLHSIEKAEGFFELKRQLKESETRYTKMLMEVQENERQRIAQEIHDELGQGLTLLKLDFAWLSNRMDKTKPDVQARLDNIKTHIDRTIKNTRKLSNELRPSMLDNLGLPDTVEWQVQQFRDRLEINIDLTLDVQEDPYPATLNTALFRILQEGLTNISRHAKASRVNVRLIQKNQTVTLSIIDNGVGTPERSRHNPTSFGLLGIEERTKILNGRYAISKGPDDSGTQLKITVPLAPTKG